MRVYQSMNLENCDAAICSTSAQVSTTLVYIKHSSHWIDWTSTFFGTGQTILVLNPHWGVKNHIVSELTHQKNVYDISIPDSFMYTCYRSCIWYFNTWQFHVYLLQVMYMIFQYLTVSCIHCYMTFQYLTFQYLTASCIPVCYRSCIWHFNTWQFHEYLLRICSNISSYDT